MAGIFDQLGNAIGSYFGLFGNNGGGGGGTQTPAPEAQAPTPPSVMPPQQMPWGMSPSAIRQMIQDQAQYAMAMTPHPSLPEEAPAGKNMFAIGKNATGTPYFNWNGPWSPQFEQQSDGGRSSVGKTLLDLLLGR